VVILASQATLDSVACLDTVVLVAQVVTQDTAVSPATQGSVGRVVIRVSVV